MPPPPPPPSMPIALQRIIKIEEVIQEVRLTPTNVPCTKAQIKDITKMIAEVLENKGAEGPSTSHNP